jgi:hypothetical protein
MLRHSRAITRHHRERIIRKNKELLDNLWHNGWTGGPDGLLAKGTRFHHHHCHTCNDPKYNRATAKREEAQYMGSIPESIFRNGHR